MFSSSAGKEATCNAGDPSSIPGSVRYPGKGIGYPLQYSWASLVTQLVKNLPAMQDTWILSWGWQDPLEKEKAIHSSILAWGKVAKSWIWLSDFHFLSIGLLNKPKQNCKGLVHTFFQGNDSLWFIMFSSRSVIKWKETFLQKPISGQDDYALIVPIF